MDNKSIQLSSSKIALNDSELIERPHGFINTEELLTKEIKDLLSSSKYSKSEVNEVLDSRRPFLKANGKKNRRLKKLESLFISTEQASFELIAKQIGLNKTIKEYSIRQREILINLQKQFNKKCKKPWSLKLASTHGIQGISFDGLKLIPTK